MDATIYMCVYLYTHIYISHPYVYMDSNFKEIKYGGCMWVFRSRKVNGMIRFYFNLKNVLKVQSGLIILLSN